MWHKIRLKIQLGCASTGTSLLSTAIFLCYKTGRPCWLMAVFYVISARPSLSAPNSTTLWGPVFCHPSQSARRVQHFPHDWQFAQVHLCTLLRIITLKGGTSEKKHPVWWRNMNKPPLCNANHCWNLFFTHQHEKPHLNSHQVQCAILQTNYMK